jgi:acyltransferase
LFGHVLATTPLGVGQAIPLVAFLIAGRGIARLVPLIRRPLLTGAGMLVVSAATIAWVPLAPFDLKGGDWGTPVVELVLSLLICAGMILIALQIRLPTGIASLASLVATAAIAVVLGHPVVITEGRLDLIPSRIILVVAILLPWIGATLIRLSPLSLPVTGWWRFRRETGLRTPRREASPPVSNSSPQPETRAAERNH